MDEQRAAAGHALREALVDRLVAAGTVRTPAVEAAMRAVPRERFVPDLDVSRVYDDRAQLVKESEGATLSTISQPTMIAIMLELARLAPGDRVLEIGAGTGYNAALLGHIVGAGGSVISIDVEEDLVRDAADALADVGPHNVEVHAADGRSGWPDGAPYDCVFATVGVATVPPAWRAQVRDGGRLLVPLLDPRTLRVERRDGDEWETEATSPAAFIPLR